VKVVEPWTWAGSRRAEFDSDAVAYDAYRPRYPEGLFDAIVDAVGAAQSSVVEIGSGTGIATEAMARRGMKVTAVEPAIGMAAVARAKLGPAINLVASTFEEWEPTSSVDAVVAFTSWHWINPAVGVEKILSILRPGGVLALIWTEVLQFGQPPFDERSGYQHQVVPLAHAIERHLDPLDQHPALAPRVVTRYRFAEQFDADRFVAVARTYPGLHSDDHFDRIRHLIDHDFGGQITKIQDAVLYLYRRH
jgi:SAM-dependent methyltransferase